MNRRHSAILIPAILLAACGGASEKAPTGDSTRVVADTAVAAPVSESYRRYEVKSGSFERKNSALPSMVEIIYFDDYGAREAIYSSVTIMGKERRTVDVTGNGWKISYDPIGKAGVKMKLPSMQDMIVGSLPRLDDITEEKRRKYRIEDLPSRAIAGQEAKGYALEMGGTKIKAWLWNNILLYSETDMGVGKPVIVEVSKLQAGVPVPADKFEVPADVKLTEQQIPGSKPDTGIVR